MMRPSRTLYLTMMLIATIVALVAIPSACAQFGQVTLQSEHSFLRIHSSPRWSSFEVGARMRCGAEIDFRSDNYGPYSPPCYPPAYSSNYGPKTYFGSDGYPPGFYDPDAAGRGYRDYGGHDPGYGGRDGYGGRGYDGYSSGYERIRTNGVWDVHPETGERVWISVPIGMRFDGWGRYDFSLELCVIFIDGWGNETVRPYRASDYYAARTPGLNAGQQLINSIAPLTPIY